MGLNHPFSVHVASYDAWGRPERLPRPQVYQDADHGEMLALPFRSGAYTRCLPPSQPVYKNMSDFMSRMFGEVQMAGKTELIETVAQSTGLSKSDVGKVLLETLAEIRHTVGGRDGRAPRIWDLSDQRASGTQG